MFARRILPITVLGLSALLLAGCLADLVKQPEIEDPWPVQVEFFPTQVTRGESNQESVFTTVEVQLVGPLQDTDQRIHYSVAPERTNAIANVHYRLRTNSPVTIEAGETTAEIEIEILSNSLADGARREVRLQLEGNDQIGVVPPHQRYTLIIEGN